MGENMDILVIDRESLTNQLISSKLQARGHTVVMEPNKNEAFEKIKIGNFDCILLDPAPLSDARPVMIGIWKSLRAHMKPYLIMLSKTATQEEAIAAGTNDVLLKPFSVMDLDTKIGNAERLIEITRHLAKEDNVHSTGGMIGKAAFNQLFLSAIDRSFRYGERSFIVFLSMINYDAIVAALGAAAAEETLQKLTEKVTSMRRQSDVIGRLGASDFGILLQRPQYETEPADAFTRFCEIIDKFYNTFKDPAAAPQLELSLVSLPQGALHEERIVPSQAADQEKEEGGNV
ncbi:MAG: diguanylate cyclase [Alphaproteobacteria bacterium]|nr:diguanylate cyclase [Alphaproteobacteria bacterium]